MFVHIMPLIHLTVQNNDLKLAVWEFPNNALSSLEKYLEDQYFSASLEGVRLEKRRREIIGTKLLKRTLGIPPLTYESTGKPIPEEGHVSISHSENMVGIIHADFSVGLDLQIPSDKLFRVRSKFCNSQELFFAKNSEDELNSLTLIWATKEAVFKMFGKNIPFADGMNVKILDERNIMCEVKTSIINTTIRLSYFWLKGQVVVYTAAK